MVEHRHDGVPVTNDAMQKWMRVREVRSKLAAHPISHENVLAWALQGENIEPGVRDDLLARMEGSIRNMRPFERGWAVLLMPSTSRTVRRPWLVSCRFAAACLRTKRLPSFHMAWTHGWSQNLHKSTPRLQRPLSLIGSAIASNNSSSHGTCGGGAPCFRLHNSWMLFSDL